jgi:hypothetical protein
MRLNTTELPNEVVEYCPLVALGPRLSVLLRRMNRIPRARVLITEINCQARCGSQD